MFRLHKWYLDVVTDTGDVLILYAGTVECGRIAFDYASVLQYRDGVTREQCIAEFETPACVASVCSWRPETRVAPCSKVWADSSM